MRLGLLLKNVISLSSVPKNLTVISKTGHLGFGSASNYWQQRECQLSACVKSHCLIQRHSTSEYGLVKSVTAGLRKGGVTHSTIDNIDAAQDTITGAGTTHFTKKLFFQLLREDQDVLPTIAECPPTPLSIDDEPEIQSVHVPDYSLGKRCGPSVFARFYDRVIPYEVNTV